MPDPLRQVSTRATSQSEQADPKQVPNSAGGYGFQVTSDARLHRFLTLGSQSGTYYVCEQALTKQNAEVVLDWAKNRPGELVEKLTEVSVQGRAPKNNPALFALAAAASLGDENGRKAAFEVLSQVARTGTHLYTFAGYAEQFRGWGRGLRRAVSEWLLTKNADQLAYQLVKYRARDGWKHADLLRLAHPTNGFASTAESATSDQLRLGRVLSDYPAHRALFDFACGRPAGDNLPALAAAYLEALGIDRSTAGAKAKGAAYVRLIAGNPGLPWEALPDSALTQPDVWAELIRHGLPQTALLRQLPRLTTLGVLTQLGMLTEMVTAQLTDADRLRKARVHPVAVLLAAKTYASGHAVRGDGRWAPVPKIIDALDAAFYAAYGAVEPANKRTMVALDVSRSMGAAVGGLPLTCREGSVALALVTAATEPQVLITGFTAGSSPSRWGTSYGTAITSLNISPRQRLDDAVHAVSGLPFGGTDCSLPMLWAMQNKVEVDSFEIITDNETWAGNIHPHQALRQYRERMGIPARLAVAAMTSTDFTIADPDDLGSLDISGFDSAVPTLLADFSRGDV